jgi:hypothetical protein
MKVAQEPPRILLVLEADDEVIRLCRVPDYAGRWWIGAGEGRAGSVVLGII